MRVAVKLFMGSYLLELVMGLLAMIRRIYHQHTHEIPESFIELQKPHALGVGRLGGRCRGRHYQNGRNPKSEIRSNIDYLDSECWAKYTQIT